MASNVDDLLRLLLSQQRMPMQASPELSSYMAQRAGPLPTRPDMTNVLDPGGWVPEMSRGLPPPISRDPWFDQIEDVGEHTPITRKGSPQLLYIWFTDPTGRRVRIDGPFTNEVEAQRELRLMMQSTENPEFLSIGPDAPR